MQRKFETLDALRGVAAIAVVLFHLQQPFPSLMLAPHGYLAVDLFFALSGFVIAHAYDGPLSQRNGFRRFVLTRAIRLYPVYLLGFGLALWTAARAPGLSGGLLTAGALAWLLFLPSLSPHGLLFPYNGPSWSLSFELAVNLAFAALHRRLSKRAIALGAVAGAVCMIVAAARSGDINLGHTLSPLHLVGGVGRVVFSFGVGVLLQRTQARWPPLPAVPPLLLLVTAALLLGAPTAGWLTPAYDLAFAFVASPLLIALAVRAAPPRKLAPSFRWLADVSYPLYVLHWPVRDLAIGAANGTRLPPELSAALWLGATLLLCRPLARFYDEPVRRWLARRLLGPAAARAAPTAVGAPSPERP